MSDVTYLTFSSAEPFTIATSTTAKNWEGALYYSTDTQTWSEWDGTTTVASAKHDGKQRIYMRGRGNSVISSGKQWVLTGRDISCSGNIEYLLDYETVTNGKHPIMAESCYSRLFCDCTSLTTAPELPATTLANYCYYYMFSGCTSLTSAPELPATTLAKACYLCMFDDCTSLTSAPELPATTLADSCYNFMFNGCTSLTSAPELPATTLVDYCYTSMFTGCTSLTTAPDLPATTLAEYCYKGMFYGCTSLTTLPQLPATTLAGRCYHRMFYGCTSIKISETQTGEYQTAYRVPASGVGTEATNALSDMFTDTGGTFTGTPTINTTYYMAVHDEPEPEPEPEEPEQPEPDLTARDLYRKVGGGETVIEWDGNTEGHFVCAEFVKVSANTPTRDELVGGAWEQFVTLTNETVRTQIDESNFIDYSELGVPMLLVGAAVAVAYESFVLDEVLFESGTYFVVYDNGGYVTKLTYGTPTTYQKMTLYKKVGGKLIPLDEHTKEVKT